VAFEYHDYFGGRWGAGISMDPTDPLYGERAENEYAFTLTPGTQPYLGTTAVQIRSNQTYLNALQASGIPLLAGEFTGQGEAEPNMLQLVGTMTSAFNSLSVSWAFQSYNGVYTIFKSDGTPEPWATVLAAAAAAP
jgi:hypothetical protein